MGYRQLVPVSYPAVATEALVSALRDAAASVSVKVHEGIVLTSDLFYRAKRWAAICRFGNERGLLRSRWRLPHSLSYADYMVLRQQRSSPLMVIR